MALQLSAVEWNAVKITENPLWPKMVDPATPQATQSDVEADGSFQNGRKYDQSSFWNSNSTDQTNKIKMFQSLIFIKIRKPR